MRRLEIIHLRSSGTPPETLSDRIRRSVHTERPTQKSVTLYHRDDLKTDIAIHIRHPESDDECGPSFLGLHFATALRAFGLVEHTVWEEMK